MCKIRESVLLFFLPALLYADTFGTGANAFVMDFVPISGGPEADSPIPQNSVRYGAVPYDYRMGKHEVSRAMISAYNALGGGPAISMMDMTSYGGNGTNRPAMGVTWNEAARFVNWLNVSTGRSPAYKFTTGGANDNIALWTEGESGYDPSNRYRNANAFYFLPSEDEWHRAAHCDLAAGVYRDYPTGTDLPNTPTSVTNGTNWNTAVFGLSVATGPADVTRAGGLSPFGTMAQGGNAAEWVESADVAPNTSPASNRVVRGGGWYLDEFWLRSMRQGAAPTAEGFIGFRVASTAPVLRMLYPRRLENAFVVDIESNVGAVDVYRSTDLSGWGGAPVATNVVPGSDAVIDPAPPGIRAFYRLTTSGTAPPGGD